MSEVTQILARAQQGDPTAPEALLPLVYAELRRLAALTEWPARPPAIPCNRPPWFMKPGSGSRAGHFIVIGDAILSSCTSADARYTGTEFLLQESSDRYINRGTLFSTSGRISSWSLILSRKG